MNDTDQMSYLGYLCNYAVAVKIHIFRIFFFISNALMSAILFTYCSRRDTDLMEEKERGGKKPFLRPC